MSSLPHEHCQHWHSTPLKLQTKQSKPSNQCGCSRPGGLAAGVVRWCCHAGEHGTTAGHTCAASHTHGCRRDAASFPRCPAHAKVRGGLPKEWNHIRQATAAGRGRLEGAGCRREGRAGNKIEPLDPTPHAYAQITIATAVPRQESCCSQTPTIICLKQCHDTGHATPVRR